jgi:radical SAM protein with 4Fe4S-binding SPASM domain
MIGLRNDCTLLINDNKTYITVCGYNVPIPWHMAFLLSLMDGTKSQEAAVDMVIELGLASVSQKKRILSDFIMTCSVYMENYSDGFIRPDMLSLEKLLKIKQREINIFEYPLPRAALFHVTSSCDKACIYCYLDAKHTPLETDILSKNEIFKIIDQLRLLGISKIIYTGGEPFVRPDFIEILKYASKDGISNTVTTKHYFTEIEAEQIGKMKLVKIALSYDCHVNSIADFLSGKKGHARKMDTSIKRLLHYGVQLSIEPVVTGVNADVMEEFLSHLHEMGVDEVEFHRYVHAGGRHDDRLTLTPEQWAGVLKLTEAKIIEDTHLYNETIERVDEEDASLTTGCVNGILSLSIMPNGKVVLCDHMPDVLEYCYGDLKKQSIEEIWSGEIRNNLIYPKKENFIDTPCENCEHFSICLKKTACRKQSVLEHGNALRPSSITCNLCLLFREGMKNQINNEGKDLL